MSPRKMKVERLTVRNLIEALRSCPPDSPVAVSSDPEGNAVRFLEAVSIEAPRTRREFVCLWPSHMEVES